MNVLQIALAIAVSMLMFSTLASMVVEILHKVLGVRRKGLKKMLTAFYACEVKQRMQAMLRRESAAGDDMQKFIDKITLAGSDASVTTIEFIRRLADTEIGKGISDRADSEIDALIEEIAVRYEEYGRQASLWFRNYSQIGTVIVSVIVALCLNINGLIIFSAFQNNEALTRKVALQAEQAMAAYQVQEKSLAAALQEGDSRAAAMDTDIEDLKRSVAELKKSVAAATDLGLPIGWSNAWSNGRIFDLNDIEPLGWAVWIFTTILTGLLIGLGGPFWYDVVKRLTPINQLAGALVRQPPPKNDAVKETDSAKSGAATAAEDPKTAFKSVIRANRILDNTGAEDGGLLGPKALRL